LAVVVVAAEGYSVLRKFGGPSYTYLQQGNAQYRVDSAAGRPDRLGTGGWETVSFDRPPESLQLNESLVSLNKGEWGPKDICFEASNNSSAVLQDIEILVSLDPKPVDDNYWDDFITLKRDAGGYLEIGKTSLFCSPAPRTFPSGSTWTYKLLSVTGWKEE